MLFLLFVCLFCFCLFPLLFLGVFFVCVFNKTALLMSAIRSAAIASGLAVINVADQVAYCVHALFKSQNRELEMQTPNLEKLCCW